MAFSILNKDTKSNSLFCFREVTIDNVNETLSIIDIWKKVANELIYKTNINSLIDRYNISKSVLFLTGGILESLKNGKFFLYKNLPRYTAYLCEDSNKEAQGIIVLDFKPRKLKETDANAEYLPIECLVVNPSNISQHLMTHKTEQNPIKGVGTAMIQLAKHIAIQKGRYGLLVESTSSSRTFYEKIGFQKEPKWDLYELAFSREKALCEGKREDRLFR